MKLLVATRNRNKVAEIRRPLERAGWQVITLADVEGAPDVKEDGQSFEENARKKARAAATLGIGWTMAEDAGLEIDALAGEPGVMSARYCGQDATDADRMRRVLDKMVAVPDEKRTARFRCLVCVISPDGEEAVFEGVCSGRIAHSARGSAGFGYDPVFMPEGYGRTFAELGMAVKHRISHRAKALRRVLHFLNSRVRLQTELFSSSG